MRIFILLVLVISISIATAKKEENKKSSPVPVSVSSNKTSRSAKSLRETRGKRTLTNLGYPDFSYSLDFANRRQGYSDARAFYSQDGLFSGQSAIGQYSIPDTSNHLPDYSQFSQYPQYLEAPEPIIEIIIKDSNETVPTQQPQPIVQKKKKEKVHVYYVKYKKDENNKLHLDEPIASLSENEASPDESEEIVHYPSIVTPLPPVKTTTLRTVIHPDSEKFHSNSGIQVTFGSEDRSQSGHELQEHNAESIQRSVVALPQSGSFNSGPSPTANVRADYSSARGSSVDSYQSFYQNQNQNSQREYKPAIQQQQLPEAQALTSFRPQLPLQHQGQPQHQNNQQQQQQLPQIHQNFQNFQQNQQQQQQPQQQHQQQPQQQHHQHQQQQQQQHQQHHPNEQQQQQRPFYNQGSVSPQSQFPQPQYQRPPVTTPPPPPPAPQYQNYHQQSIYQQQQKQQQQQYYQFNQQPKKHPVPSAQPNQYQQQQQQHHQQHHQQQQYQQRPVTPAQKQTVFFPTPPPKSQDLPSRQSLTSYQPVKFRPTPVPSIQKLESPNGPPLAQAQQYNRPPSYVQQPTYSTLPQSQGPQYAQRYQKPQVQKHQNPRPEQYYNQQQQQQLPFNHKQQQSQINSFGQSQPSTLSQLHSLFDARPSKETELLKAIPKFEQHITETVNGGNRYKNYQTYSGGSQVIHDIPAPNLGPTTPTSGHSTSSGQFNGGSSTHYQQLNNFVTSPNPIQYQSSTPAPQYVKSEDGQQIQIVTPMPSTTFYNQQGQAQSQFITSGSGSGSQPQIIPNSQPKQQTFYNHQQQPRQPDSSQFSVSTLHSDVFKELEYRKNTLAKQNNINIQPKHNFKNFVTESENKTPSTTSTSPAPTTTSKNAAKASLQLPDEVPDDLRQQLLSSGILDNADISILDYDKVGDVALENLPAEHLQHFYGAGGGAQISESNKVLTVVKPNGDSVDFSEKNINRVKESNSLPRKQNVDLKVVHFNANNEKNVTNKHIKTDSTVVPPIDLADKQYNRYLPLKINGAQFPIPDVEELQGKKISSVVVLAPVDNIQSLENERPDDERIERDTSDSKEVKFATGDIIKQLIKKPTKENFKKWLEKESGTDVDSQSVVLLVAKSSSDDQEIFMYDIATGAVNKLNGELSSAFVSVAEENASAENLDRASTLDPSTLENMMEKMKNV